MRLKKVLFVGLIASLLITFKTGNVSAEACEDIPNTKERIQEKISCLEAKKAELATQSRTLSNQIEQFNTQIRLTELKIAQTEDKISLLGGRIDQLQASLMNLNEAFSSRVIETYKIARFTDGFTFVVTAGDIGEIFSRFHYLRKIQEGDRSLLLRLTNAQNTYKEEKTDQEKLQEELESQQQVLGAQKAAKANLLASTKGEEARYQRLLAQAKAQLAAFSRFVASQGGATILSNQTKSIDGWGYYYNQRDSQWGNMAMGNSSSSMAEYGCLVTSMAMVTSHHGKSLKPSDIAATPSVFFGDTAYMNQGTWTAAGVTTTRTRVCSWCGESTVRQKIDEEVNAGRPVVVGLYGGPDHFIVILRKEGDNYIMNDPFIPDGGNKPLSDKYSVSDISTVDIVRVN